MTIDNDDLLNSIRESLDRVKYISPEDIPNIDLYMDQVTTFMDSRLQSSARYPGKDKPSELSQNTIHSTMDTPISSHRQKNWQKPIMPLLL